MSLFELITFINQNGFVIALGIFLLSCIKLPKYELNIWQLFLKGITKETNIKLDALEKQIRNLTVAFDKHIQDDEEEEMTRVRRAILNFNSELTRGELYTEEQFNQIIEDVDKYESFCRNHPTYQNTKAVASIKNIKNIYSIKLERNDFL